MAAGVSGGWKSEDGRLRARGLAIVVALLRTEARATESGMEMAMRIWPGRRENPQLSRKGEFAARRQSHLSRPVPTLDGGYAIRQDPYLGELIRPFIIPSVFMKEYMSK